MAKGNVREEDRAKVKLRVIEFELEGANSSVENSIRQLATALTARTNGGSKLPPSKPPKELASGETEDPAQEAEPVEAEVVDDGADAQPAKTKTARPKSKPKPPTYLPNLNLTGKNGITFKEFAKEKAPTTRPKQYLVATYWLKEHGEDQTVNADKIYTCFKTAGWPIGFNDWRAAFDQLVHSEHLRKVGVGEFAINPLGEDAVTKGTDA
jgi:hypothetical protein